MEGELAAAAEKGIPHLQKAGANLRTKSPNRNVLLGRKSAMAEFPIITEREEIVGKPRHRPGTTDGISETMAINSHGGMLLQN